MTDSITIVTAFFDIGRGNWTTDVQKNGQNLPHYLERSPETYIDRFANLCKLDNELVVYTTAGFAGRFTLMRAALGFADKTTVVIVDYPTQFQEKRNLIQAVLDNPEWINQVNPHQRKNPEYWSADYVLVTSLKAWFVNDAIEKGYATNETAAWIDFGYCRTEASLNGSTTWTYDFDKEKIHYFNCKEFGSEDPNGLVYHAITNNDVIIHGAMVVAEKSLWKPLSEGMQHAVDLLLAHNMIDDDQGLWLVCYFAEPAKFQLHALDYNDPFIIFRDYNTNGQ